MTAFNKLILVITFCHGLILITVVANKTAENDCIELPSGSQSIERPDTNNKECVQKCLDAEYEKQIKKRDRTEDMGHGCKCGTRLTQGGVCGNDGVKYRNICLMKCLSRKKSVRTAFDSYCEVKKNDYDCKSR